MPHQDISVDAIESLRLVYRLEFLDPTLVKFAPRGQLSHLLTSHLLVIEFTGGNAGALDGSNGEECEVELEEVAEASRAGVCLGLG